jgi:hypothetical protein
LAFQAQRRLGEVQVFVFEPQAGQDRQISNRPLVGDVGLVERLPVVEQVDERRRDHKGVRRFTECAAVVEAGVDDLQVVAGLQLAGRQRQGEVRLEVRLAGQALERESD